MITKNIRYLLIEQYLPNISDAVYSVHQSFMWFLWLSWRKSTFYPITAPNYSKCWPIVTSLIQEPAASNCYVTMTDCSRVVAMDAFLAQWNRKFITAQWSTENTSCFNLFFFNFFFICDPRVSTRGITRICNFPPCGHQTSPCITSRIPTLPLSVCMWPHQDLFAKINLPITDCRCCDYRYITEENSVSISFICQLIHICICIIPPHRNGTNSWNPAP